MKCIACDNKKLLKAKKVTIKYDLSGLDNIRLHNVEEHRCEVCGEFYHNFGNLRQLHELIADLLIRKQVPLNNKEVRFLRTHLGYSGQMFAKLMGYTYETVSRFESGARPIPTSFDHALRAMAFAKHSSTNYDLHDLVLSSSAEKKDVEPRFDLERKKSGWSPMVAA